MGGFALEACANLSIVAYITLTEINVNSCDSSQRLYSH